MVSFSDLDTAFLKPCARCGELLQDHERFCRFCGKDQNLAVTPSEKLDALLSARPGSGSGHGLGPDAASLGPEPGEPAEDALARPIPSLQDVAPLRKRPQRAVTAGVNTLDGRPIGPPPSSGFPVAALNALPAPGPRDSGFAFTTSQPSGAWLDELPSRRDARSLMRTSRRLSGVVLALALMLGGALWWEHRGGANALSLSSARPDFASQVALVEDALARGDLRAATRGIEALKADHPGETSVAQLQARLQGQTNERTAKLQALEDAARRASQALGMHAASDAGAAQVIVSVPSSTSATGSRGTSAAAPSSGAANRAPAAAARPTAHAEVAVAPIATPATPVAVPQRETQAAVSAPAPAMTPAAPACNDALAALALCVRP